LACDCCDIGAARGKGHDGELVWVATNDI